MIDPFPVFPKSSPKLVLIASAVAICFGRSVDPKKSVISTKKNGPDIKNNYAVQPILQVFKTKTKLVPIMLQNYVLASSVVVA